MAETLTGYIAAGGIGSRLRPHTDERVKPMLPMGSSDKRIIDYPLSTCNPYCDHMYVTTCFRAEQVENYVSGKQKVHVLHDSRVVGNGGSILEHANKILAEDISGNFLVIPGDHVLEDFPIKDFVNTHIERKSDITLMVVPPKPFGEYVVMNNDVPDRIVFSPEKNSFSTIGIYLISNRYLFGWMHAKKRLHWDGEDTCVTRDIIDPAVGIAKTGIYHLPETSYWDDAGTPARYHHNNMRLSGEKTVIDTLADVSPHAILDMCVVVGNAAIPSDIMLSRAIVSQNVAGKLNVTQL